MKVFGTDARQDDVINPGQYDVTHAFFYQEDVASFIVCGKCLFSRRTHGKIKHISWNLGGCHGLLAREIATAFQERNTLQRGRALDHDGDVIMLVYYEDVTSFIHCFF